MTVTTFTSTTDGNINDGATYGNTSPGSAGTDYPDTDDICVVGAGTDVTLNTNFECRAVKITGTGSPGTLTATSSYTLTVNGATSNKPFDNDGIISGDLNLTITNSGLQQDDLLLDAMGSSGNLNDLTLNLTNGTTANKTVGISDATTIDGNLTINSGATLDTVFSGGSAANLTVVGTTSVDGTLTCNASTVSLGSGYTAGYGLLGGGTINFGTGTITVGAVNTTSASGITKTSGTITFNTKKTGGQSFGPSVSNANSHFNFGTSTVNIDSSTGTAGTMSIEQHSGSSKTFQITCTTLNIKSNTYIYQNNTDTNIFKLTGDLVIDASKTFETFYDDANDYGSKLEITGDVTVNGTLNAYSANNPKPMEFGSLTIASGAEYKATSGTTTITGTSNADWNWTNNGTFTHNNGKVKFFTDSTSMEMWISNGDIFYDLEIDSADPSGVYYHNNIIYGDLTVTDGVFHAYTTSTTLTVHGNTYIKSEGQLINGAAQSGTVTFHGLITNEGILHTGSGINNFNGGVRNLNSMPSDDTITIEGTGGILEGPLDDAVLDIHLDAALLFDGVNDSIDCNDVSTLDGATDITLTCWIKPVALSGTDYFLSKEVDGDNKIGIAWDSDLLYFQVADDANAYGTCAFDDATYNGVWTHLALVFDGGGSGNAGRLKAYINGVEQTLSFTGTIPAQTDSNSADFLMAKFSSNYYNGYIADVKIYNTNLGQTDIQTLASKINYPDILSTGARHWWKINEGTGTDIEDYGAATDFDGTVTGATWKFDQYYVNIQDTLTTDGNVYLGEGKVEGLSLSSVDFETSNTNTIGLASQAAETTHQTVACWLNPESLGNYRYFLGQESNKAYGFYNNDNLWVSTGPTRLDSGVTLTTGRWYHFATTWDGTTQKIYIDGVFAASVESDNRISIATIGGDIADDENWDGKIRDVRTYDFALSADQISSLYSGAFNVTPLHWWKLDEGYATAALANAVGAFSDSGTATAINGQGDDFTDALASVNGTLDLDGALLVSGNAVLSAPRGKLTVLSDFSDAGTFTHNNGEVIMEGASADIGGSSATTFYDLTSESYVDLTKSFNVENKMVSAGSNSWRLTNNMTITMGTSGSQGTIAVGTAASKGLRFTNSSKTFKFEAANEMYPFIAVSSGSQWNVTEAGNTIELKWADFQFDFDTNPVVGTNDPVTYKLTGDSTFDAVTVQASDTLNLNGQRAEFGGALTVSGTIACGTDALIYTTATNANISMDNIGTWTGNSNVIHYGEVSPHYKPNTAAAEGITNLLWLDQTNPQRFANNFVKNLYVAGDQGQFGDPPPTTGPIERWNLVESGVLYGGDRTLTIGSDFRNAGGLIGIGAIKPNKTHFASGSSTLNYSSASVEGITMSGWFRATDLANGASNQMILRQNDNFIAVQADGSVYVGVELQDASTNYVYPGIITADGTIADTKWHHLAMTWASGSTLKAYLDGKLVGENATISDDYTRLRQRAASQVVGCGGAGGGAQTFAGVVGQACRWHTAKTGAQIRAEMFEQFSELSSNTNCIYWYQFDEGGGTSIADSTSANVDLTLVTNAGVTEASWSSCGTFNDHLSTLDFVDDGGWYINDTGTQYYRVNVAATSKTTTIYSVGATERRPLITSLLTVGGGTLTDVNSADLTFTSSGTHNAGADFSGLYITYWDSSANSPGGTYQYLITDINHTMGADMTCTGYLAVGGGFTFDTGNYDITTPRMIAYSDTTTTLGSSTITFTGPHGFGSNSGQWYANRTFSAGPGCKIIGQAAKSAFVGDNDFEVVGDIENLDVIDGDNSGTVVPTQLTVAGKVINSTGNIIQWHHSQDYDQRLDTDTAEDRDIKLEGPALDNANHLNN